MRCETISYCTLASLGAVTEVAPLRGTQLACSVYNGTMRRQADQLECVARRALLAPGCLKLWT